MADARDPLTVADLVGAPALRLRTVLPGSGAPVRWAHATELVEPAPYLRGGELVCTVGQALVDDRACRAFVTSCAGAGAVGICFGVGDVHDQVPRALAEACREQALALLVLDRGVPFMALTEHLAQHRVERAVAAERVGRLLELVADRMAPAEAVLPLVVDAGLSASHLVVSAWPGGCADELDALAVAALVGATGAATYVVASAPEPVTALAAHLGVVLGACGPVAWRELGTAVHQARAGLQRALARDGGAAPAVPVTLEALLAQQTPERLEPFVARLVRPLLEADRRRESGLLDTLRDYLRLDGSLVETARTRFLHVNSVRHRLARVAELTGTDPTTLAGAAAFTTALWAHDRGAPGAAPTRPPR